MAETELRERILAVLDAGGGEELGGQRFLPLVTLESGARYAIDAELRWIVIASNGEASVVSAEKAHLLHEALEWKRDRFDAEIEAAAKTHGLPVDDLVFSFPVFDLARAVLSRQSSYMTRLALEWLRPTELRPLRAEIKAVLDKPNIPSPIKDLAARLVVPE